MKRNSKILQILNYEKLKYEKTLEQQLKPLQQIVVTNDAPEDTQEQIIEIEERINQPLQ